MRSSGAPSQRERAPHNPDRTASSRIPTRFTNARASSKTSRDPQQHVSQTGKGQLQNVAPRVKPLQESTGLPVASKRASVASDIQAAHARASASAVLRRENTLSPPVRTPSLVSATSTLNSSRSNLLRRKPSTIEQHKRDEELSSTRRDASNTKKLDPSDDAFDSDILGISMPSPGYDDRTARLAIQPLPPLLAPGSRDITSPVLTYAQSATPSTRYTDSPFSHAPTPSSASSHSPMLAVKASPASDRRHPSPTRSRPPLSGRSSEKTNTARSGLLTVRESSTSSSSSSTVKPTQLQSGRPQRFAQAKPGLVGERTPAISSQPKSRTKGREPSNEARSSTSSRTSQQVPPELAHLNVDSPPRTSRDKGLPPSRPSRDGAPMLTGIDAPSPVVQSDLSPVYTTYHKRTSSVDAPSNATSPSLRTRLGFYPKAPPVHSSPRVEPANPPPMVKGFSRGPTSDITASDASRVPRRDSPAVESTSSKSPRFGFLSRKPKIDKKKPAEKPQRQASKGPAAGTGHEGYGRFSMQRRNSSTSSSTGHRSPSNESISSSERKRHSTTKKSSNASKDGYELDEFLRERLNPVILRGSGSTVSNSTSVSEIQTPSVPSSSHTSSLDSVARPQIMPAALEPLKGVSPKKKLLKRHPAPFDSSGENFSIRNHALKRNAPIPETQRLEREREITMDRTHNFFSGNASLSYSEAKPSKQNSTKGKDNPDGQPNKAAAERRAPRKWNFFQRVQASPRDKGKATEIAAPVSMRILEQSPPYVPPAQFAMIDPVELIGLEEVEKIVREPETSPEDSQVDSYAASRVSSYEPRHRDLLASTPASDCSEESEFHTRLLPPQITVRHDSEDSSTLMYAERTIPHTAPHVVDVRRSPSLTGASGQPEQKAIANELKHSTPSQYHEAHTPEIPASPLDNQCGLGTHSPIRVPRLSPIGRIPKVVSKRDRERKLSASSFSRPFARDQPKHIVKPPGLLYNQIRDLASPVESSSQPLSSTSTNSNIFSGDQNDTPDANSHDPYAKRASDDAFERGEFFSFAPRKYSDVSYSSSSGDNSVLAILAAQPPQEEDVWHEYNDWLDEVMPGTIEKSRYSYASSLGAPFHYASALYEPLQYENREPPWQEWCQLESPTVDLPAPPRSRTVPAVMSVPQVAQYMKASLSSPNTENTISGVFSDYGRLSTTTLTPVNRPSIVTDGMKPALQPRTSIPVSRKTSALAMERSSIPESARANLPSHTGPARGAQNRASLPQSHRSSILSIASTNRRSRGSAHSRSASLPEANARNSQSSLTPSSRFNRDTQLLEIAEVDGNEQAAMASLRFGALMTSRWLSFGRVLFSPAHHEMRLADEARILIIDGLGSDWSYYVAMSYPTATVYDMGPAPISGVSDWPGVDERPPPNHRHINHATISAAFPFPKGFFTAVVLRFPLVTSDQAYQACVCECKRVLRPGGFIEVAALDLDLTNMGNKARKEVRGLKTRLQRHHQDVSLRNLSDMLVGMIGRRGFEDVQRCIVGLPAAGHIPKSQDIDSVSSGSSDKHTWEKEDRAALEFSFSDLMDDARANQLGEGRTNDENLTKMVARVGRWWYTTCYETPLLRTDGSIWNDTALLRECEKQGTSFRLLICYAQKPTQTRRRTVSV